MHELTKRQFDKAMSINEATKEITITIDRLDRINTGYLREKAVEMETTEGFLPPLYDVREVLGLKEKSMEEKFKDNLHKIIKNQYNKPVLWTYKSSPEYLAQIAKEHKENK